MIDRAQFKKGVLMRACTMSRIEMNNEIDRLLDRVMNKALSEAELSLAKEEAAEFAKLLLRREGTRVLREER